MSMTPLTFLKNASNALKWLNSNSDIYILQEFTVNKLTKQHTYSFSHKSVCFTSWMLSRLFVQMKNSLELFITCCVKNINFRWDKWNKTCNISSIYLHICLKFIHQKKHEKFEEEFCEINHFTCYCHEKTSK